MKVFEDVDIEFFDMKTDKPNNREEVVIVLKTEDSKKYYGLPSFPSTKKAVTFALYKSYKSVPSKFTDRTGYIVRNYKEDEVVCWGRLK